MLPNGVGDILQARMMMLDTAYNNNSYPFSGGTAAADLSMFTLFNIGYDPALPMAVGSTRKCTWWGSR